MNKSNTEALCSVKCSLFLFLLQFLLSVYFSIFWGGRVRVNFKSRALAQTHVLAKMRPDKASILWHIRASDLSEREHAKLHVLINKVTHQLGQQLISEVFSGMAPGLKF